MPCPISAIRVPRSLLWFAVFPPLRASLLQWWGRTRAHQQHLSPSRAELLPTWHPYQHGKLGRNRCWVLPVVLLLGRGKPTTPSLPGASRSTKISGVRWEEKKTSPYMAPWNPANASPKNIHGNCIFLVILQCLLPPALGRGRTVPFLLTASWLLPHLPLRASDSPYAPGAEESAGQTPTAAPCLALVRSLSKEA